MSWYLVDFDNRPRAQISAVNEQAARTTIAALLPEAIIKRIQVNPYRCSGVDLIGGDGVDDWALCYTPGSCAGRTSCPKAYACSE